MDKHSVALL